MRNLVILGGGYGGMRAIQRLISSNLPSDIQITLVDKHPYHCLKTEYYALVAGTVSEQHIRVDFPSHIQLVKKYGTITKVDIKNKKVILENNDTLLYDDLIIGLGCEDKYHGVEGAKENTYSVQSIEQVRNAYENINNLPPYATVAIVGAGLSGVEIASELKQSRRDLQIKLFDRKERILSPFPHKLSTYITKWFTENEIEIIPCANITKVEPNILYNHGNAIRCSAIIWTAGIRPNKIIRDIQAKKDTTGRILVTKYHHLPHDEHVYIIGDCASSVFAPSGQLAEAQAEQVVTILLKRWNNDTLPETMPHIKLKGILGALGKKHGFGLVGEKAIIGRVPRLLKSGLLWVYKYHRG